MKNKTFFLNISLIATLIAVGIHFYLTKHFYDLNTGMLSEDSLCNINSFFNCDAVTASRFSSLFGIPIALYGAMTNLILLIFTLIGRFNLSEDSDKTLRYTGWLATLVLGASVVMASISLTQIGHFCLFCGFTYLLSIFSFGGVFLATKPHPFSNLGKDLKELIGGQKWVAIMLLVVPVGAMILNMMFWESRGAGNIKQIVAEKVAYWKTSPVASFDPNRGLIHYSGDGEPTATVVEFADYRCPHCKTAAPTLDAFSRAHPDVKFIFKPFPLDGTCNSAITGGDGISCGLAYTVFCAEKLNQKGWATHKAIFDNQATYSQQQVEKTLEQLAPIVGFDVEPMKTCLQDPEIQTLVREAAKEGEVAKIRGTPAVFIEGKSLGSGIFMPILEGVYQDIRKSKAN